MQTFNKQQIQSLPTLADVVVGLKAQIEKITSQENWHGFHLGYSGTDWSFSFSEFCNDADDDKFIVVQTNGKRHTLKPNLRNRPFIFRGQNKVFPHILSSFSRDDFDKKGNPLDSKVAHAKHLVGNLKSEEFCDLLKTNPLFMMLDRGIILEPERKPIFINMNYYGLAQHYGFKTAVVDFTSEIDVAAFFACTKNEGFDKYSPITDITKHPYGVIYVHEINPAVTFKFAGFSTIGLQIYPRSGAQKGLLFNEPIVTVPVERMVKPVYFKHDPMISKHFYNKMSDKLFPSDSISKYAEELLSSNEISGKTFMQNIYTNQENFEENLAELSSQGVCINWHKQHHFSNELLKLLDEELKNGLWEQFCNQICFADIRKGEAMLESLLQLPKNPAYAHYFKMSEYNRITNFDTAQHERALRNASKKGGSPVKN